MTFKKPPSSNGYAAAAKKGAEATANTVRTATNLVAYNERPIADFGQAATGALGAGLKAGGDALQRTGSRLGRTLHGNAASAAQAAERMIAGDSDAGGGRKAAGKLFGLVVRTTTHAAGLAAQAGGLAGKVVSATGRLTGTAAPVVGGTVGGLVKGVADVTSDAVDAVMLPPSSIDEMRQQLKRHGESLADGSERRLSAIEAARRQGQKSRMLDLLVIGGVTLSSLVKTPASVPASIENAYRLAYPDLALRETFADAVARMSPDQLLGFTSAVKGKLFEIQLVEHLNNGVLPDGYQAELAGSAVQPGWDLRILDESGQVSEVLQAKATESVHYVKEAMEKYPLVDVSTTSEVYAELTALGIAEGVRDSGISEEALQASVEAAASGGDVMSAADTILPTSIGLAVIALSVFMQKDLDSRMKGAEFGNRASKATASVVAGKAAMVATQTWWLGLMAGLTSGWLSSRGHHKRQQYEALKEAASIVKKVRSRKFLAQTEAYRMKVLGLSK